ncbi:hypothetical protein C7Y47_18865 [Lysinibacillus sphaericus]|uniref:Lipoprotein n=1 Tax=Lysinibacillus sphaericus TaxID=1421 RepID=A0A544U9Z4_LYSSH|nr:hypothetical protein [Lysinibacillus sp. SDF0037]TQR28955.1 hypothetical protein C7Y47_18865 [Lysinibacillus sp. SDF0037]
MRLKELSSFSFILVLLVGCDSEKKFTLNDIQKVKLELIEKETLKGGLSYSIKLINDSDYVIKQNNVFVSFMIKEGENAYKGNEYKVEAKGNKLDIQSGEKVTLNVFMPFEGMGDQSLLGIDNPIIQLKVFMEVVDDKHQFTTGGGLIKD